MTVRNFGYSSSIPCIFDEESKEESSDQSEMWSIPRETRNDKIHVRFDVPSFKTVPEESLLLDGAYSEISRIAGGIDDRSFKLEESFGNQEETKSLFRKEIQS